MIPQYSIAITFPEDITTLVGKMKKRLSEEIGWFHSVNAKAHITINKFKGGPKTLAAWETYLTAFCKQNNPFEIRLVRTGTYPAGTLFLYPDDASVMATSRMMRNFHKNTSLDAFGKSTDPHLSIARKLTADQMAAAEELWKEMVIDIRCTCDKLTIRRFDESKGQYDNYQDFYFEGKPLPSLFPEDENM